MSSYAAYEMLPPEQGEGVPAEETPALPVSIVLQQEKSNSRWRGFWNLANAILGVGLLVLPAVVARIGVGTSMIYLAFVAFLTFLSLDYLTIASARSGELRYSKVARVYTGLFGSFLVDLSLIVNCGGLLIVYFIILGDLLVGTPSSEGLLSPSCGDRSTVLLVLTLLIIAPLVSTQRLRSLAGVSALGVVAIVFWALIMVLLFVVALTNAEVKTGSLQWWPTGKYIGHKFESAVHMIAIFPILLVAFICQMTLQHVLTDITDTAQSSSSGVGRLSGAALTLSSISFLAVGISGAGLFGSDVDADVLKNFTIEALELLVWTDLAHAVFMAVRLAFVISLVASFPIQMIPLRDAFWQLFFRQTLQGPGLWIVSYGLLAVIYTLGVWVRDIFEPLLLIGSTAGVLLALILPGSFAMKVPERLSDTSSSKYFRIVGGAALVLFGCVIGVFGLLRVVLYRDELGA